MDFILTYESRRSAGGISYFNNMMEDKDMSSGRAAAQTGGYMFVGWYGAKKGGAAGAALGALIGPAAFVAVPVLTIGGGVAGYFGATWLYELVIDGIFN